jgi:hypothetical protein
VADKRPFKHDLGCPSRISILGWLRTDTCPVRSGRELLEPEQFASAVVAVAAVPAERVMVVEPTIAGEHWGSW